MSTRESLTEMTVAELRQICKNSGITGMSKKRKDIIVDALLANQNTVEPVAEVTTENEAVEETPVVDERVNSLDGSFSSHLSKPNAAFGNKATTTIRVSCGASSGSFPVIGKTVGAVAEFLREVLNVERMSRGLINGADVEDSYILAETDTLEFLKPAGRKG